MMPSKQQISIIVRSMARSTLASTLDSIVASDYRPLQIVLVNAKGGPIQTLALPANGIELTLANMEGVQLGRAAAANLGLACSTGALALFLDDDDLIDSTHISRLASCLSAHPEALAAYTGVRLVDHAGNIVREQNEYWELNRLQGMNFLPIHAVMFRLPEVRKHASFDANLRLMEDWDFWNQLARRGNFIRLEGCSATYNIGLGESGLSENRDHASMLAAHAQVLERQRQIDPLAPSRALFWFDTALAHVQQEKQREAANLASANCYIVELEQRVRHEESIRAKLQREHGELQRQLQEHIQKAEASRLAAQENLRQLQQQTSQQIAAANDKLQMLSSELRQRQTELSAKLSELALAEATLERLLTSRSWKLTAPLRALATTLRNLVKH